MHDATLRLLSDSLGGLQRSRITIAEFCHTWRAQDALLTTLPPRYREAMEDLLSRIEAGSLFTEESCSFSQQDLLANLAVWLDKTTRTLDVQR